MPAPQASSYMAPKKAARLTGPPQNLFLGALHLLATSLHDLGDEANFFAFCLLTSLLVAPRCRDSGN